MIKKSPLRLIFSGIADTIRKNERGAVLFKKLIAVLLRAVVFCCAEGAVATAKTSEEADTHL